MSEIILDGTGFGYTAKVDNTNRLDVRSVTEPAIVEAAENGDAYFITSGSITLTNTANSDRDWETF